MAEQPRARIDGRVLAKVIFGVLVALFVWSPFIAMMIKMANRNPMSAPAPVPPSNLSGPAGGGPVPNP